ncbi:hypothetical protein ACOSQ2_032970 [Xanthoceras sorbifolium]
MSSSLDMSLDDIIRKNKRSKGHNRHFKGKSAFVTRSGPGPDRRAPHRDPIRTRPYPVVPRPMQIMPGSVTWQNQMMPSGGIYGETEAKLYISNLDYGVSNDDIKLLFSEISELKRYSIHYDRSGRSKGTAEVIYSSRANALAAIRRYNNMNLDGRPMKIELVGVIVIAPDSVTPTPNRILGRPNDAFRSGQDNVGAREWVHASAHGTGARGTGARATGRSRESAKGYKLGNQNHDDKKLTAQDLDAELEKYHSEAMRIKRFH